MAAHEPFRDPQTPSGTDAARAGLIRSFTILAICWTLLISGLSAWEFRKARSGAMEQARLDCLSNYNKDLAYRRWATRHGGVYVPITRETPPNPFLSDIPERDITTPSGKKLTLMNPAYMTRQVYEMAKEQYGAQGHITSLNVLRPGNAPDEWEKGALRAFESGVKEVSSLERMGNETYLRLMRPMITEPGCLKCHGRQGYKTGDIRGGLSISVPWAPYLAASLDTLHAVYWGYGAVWVIGVAGLWFAQYRTQRILLVQKQAEVDLQASEARYSTLFRGSADGILIADLETKVFSYANPAVCRMFGYSEAELRTMSVADLHPKNRLADVAAEFEAQARGDKVLAQYVPCLKKDGTLFYADISTVRNTIDGRACNIGFFRDVTERKAASDEKMQSEKRLNEAQKIAHIGDWEWDLATNKVNWSDELYRIYGYEPHTVAPDYGLIVDAMHPDSKREFLGAIDSTLKGEKPFEMNYTFYRRDGTEAVLHTIGQLVYADDGRPARMKGIVQDITDHRRAEELILRSLQEKEVLLKEIHHRVKNNMQVIYSLLNLQAKTLTDKTVRAMLEESRDRVNSMALIHEKLYRSGDLAHIDFKAYLQDLIQSIAGNYKRHDIVCSVEMEEMSLDVNIGIPCGLIVNELVSNSLKYAFPDGRKGTITAGITRNSDGNTVLTVADDGIGFPSGVDFRNTPSLGLQLVTVLTKQLHGTIVFSGEFSLAEGARFSIIFPGTTENRGNQHG